MFTDRFEGSIVHGSSRHRLSFESNLVRVNTIKDEWAFVWEDALRYNIAYALQAVHFSVLLVNHYNIYWTPEAMVYKNAIVQVASVAEAVLQYNLKMVEDDPRVKETLGKDWVFVDYKEIPLPGVDLPPGQRAVTGLQRMIEKEQLDRNSKMQVLIRASKKVAILPGELAAELDELRKLRNRIHIKSLDEPECMVYTAKMANEALDLLERYRQVAYAWTVAKRQENISTELAAKAKALASQDDDIEF